MKKYIFGTVWGTSLSILLFISLLIKINKDFEIFKLEDPKFTVLLDENDSFRAEERIRTFYNAIYKKDQKVLSQSLADQIFFQNESGETLASSSTFIEEQANLWKKNRYWFRLNKVVVDRDSINPIRVLVIGDLAVGAESFEKSDVQSDYTVPFSDVFEIEDGKITKRTTYLNAKNIERQVARK